MRGFVDRIDEGVAVLLLEGGGRAYVPLALLPAGTAPRMVLSVEWQLIGEADASEVGDLIHVLRHGEHL